MDTFKIIRGVVSNGRYTVTAPIVKEDYGLYLKIEGVELPQTYEVDFSNSESSGTSVTMIGNADGVLIPSQFISTGKDVFAFLYHVGADYGRTVYKFRIPNKLRPDRTDEEPTPEEQSVIDQAIAELNEAVAQTAQDVIDADASAQASAESAQASGESALSASNSALSSGEYASNALGYAESASASATASAQSASQSALIKTDVESLADDAQSYAQASERSASASANSASQAQGFAQSASASALSAQGYASNAQSYSQTASAKAQDASQSATTASTKASEASTSASQALTYKTDAESAKTASQTAQGLAESARDSAVQAKTDAESAKADAESARDEAQQAVASISGALAEKAPIITDTASGSIASFSDGADDLPLKSLVVDINPVQDLSQGDPSPTNICPISGWTEVAVNHSDADMTNPTTITIELGQTVYGAKLYPLEGKAVINMAMVDLGDLTWLLSSATNIFGCHPVGISNVISPPYNNRQKGALCSMFPPSQTVTINENMTDNSWLRNDVEFFVRCTTYDNVADFTSAVTGQTLVYELSTPIEIQLSANQLNSLYGVNNIWTDSGDTEVEYRADTKLYIAKKIAEAISALS